MRGSKVTKGARKTVLALLVALPCWLLTSPAQAVPSCSDCQNRLNSCINTCYAGCGSNTTCQDNCDSTCFNDPLTRNCFNHCRNPLSVTPGFQAACSTPEVAPGSFQEFLAR
ncbi:MAG TPA: hypothetical protein VGR07_06530 [Thermoanaerobaculia bacterium]|nr:hypothetical protein [Thermoanaerobaculia bacterium]